MMHICYSKRTQLLILLSDCSVINNRNITTNSGRARDVEGPNKARETDNRGWCRDRISAKFEEAGGVDLIVLYNSGRFRMAGKGLLAGLLPFADANAIVVEMANEVLPDYNAKLSDFGHTKDGPKLMCLLE
ncbi:putative TIM-barrel domain, IGPS, aldolase-type TIM barrel [Helianthus anomalus]